MLSEFSSRILELDSFEVNYYVVYSSSGFVDVLASQLVKLCEERECVRERVGERERSFGCRKGSTLSVR